MKTRALDSLWGHSYIAALFFGALLTLAAPAQAADRLVVKGAILPPGSQQVGQDRYRSPSNYADTLTFYSKLYNKEYPRKSIINQPGKRGVHIVNSGKGEWEGLNIYELDGDTRIFVVTRDPPARP